MPALLLPAALAALLALLIPLAIHLARRSEALPTDFAALQWLRQKPRPRSRIRFDEWLLLAARLLLLALVALWLARPVLPGSADRTPVVAVLPGLTATTAEGARTVWLAPGFPAVAVPAPATTTSVTSLIRQLDAELAPGVPLRVIVPAVLQGVDAERPRLSRPVDWQVVPGAMPARAATPAAPPALSLRQPPGPDRGLRYLRAAAAAWTPPGQPPAYDTAAPDAPLPTPPRILAWLAPGPLPAGVRSWIEAGGTALVSHDSEAASDADTTAWRDANGAAVATARPLGKGRLLRFTRPLDAGALPLLLEPDFPRQLAALLDDTPPLPSRVAARDLRPTPGTDAWPQPARDLQPWLALLVATLFLAERWLATRRARAPAP
ncbi:BatA domain-containing protein [Sandarakinorhabdus sp. DWP1-3-1]|uniref:BatA domain-containing protein n=1 Tax=Sandarakinorhabdus sp. DWP1-3-1 TaxID=2804627 RepID=UPI003CE7AE23